MGSSHRSTQYDPENPLARRVGSAIRDPFTKRIVHGEVNEEGLPMGGGNTPKKGAGVSGGMTATPAWNTRFPSSTGKVAAGNLDTAAHPLRLPAAGGAPAPGATMPVPGGAAPRPTNVFSAMAARVAARASGKAHAENAIAAKAPAWSTTGAGLRLGAAANSTVAAAAGAAVPAAGSITAPPPARAFPRAPTPLENRFPGWSTMSREEKAATLRANPATSANVGTTTGTGSSPFNFRGERNIQSVATEGEMGKEFDPTHDMSRSHLAAGDSLLPRDASGGVVVEPKYRTPGASIVGSTRPGSPFTRPTGRVFDETGDVTRKVDASAYSGFPKPAAPAKDNYLANRVAGYVGKVANVFGRPAAPAPAPAPTAPVSIWQRAVDRVKGAAATAASPTGPAAAPVTAPEIPPGTFGMDQARQRYAATHPTPPVPPVVPPKPIDWTGVKTEAMHTLRPSLSGRPEAPAAAPASENPIYNLRKQNEAAAAASGPKPGTIFGGPAPTPAPAPRLQVAAPPAPLAQPNDDRMELARQRRLQRDQGLASQ